MEGILSYDSDSSDKSESPEGENAAAELFSHLKPIDKSNSVSNTIALNSTPVVVPTVCLFIYSLLVNL
jgi:hypothetical protein